MKNGLQNMGRKETWVIYANKTG
nr:hypothetical protein [Tanacetum cinerariifolium]